MLQNFKRFIIFYAILTICLTIDQWFFGFFSRLCISPPPGSFTCGSGISRDIFMKMSIWQRLLGFCLNSIGTTLFVGTLYALHGVIQKLQTNHTFTQNTLNKMKQMTRFYLGSVIFYPFYETAHSVITSIHNSPRQRFISIYFGTDNLNQIFIACCLYILFRVMKEAHHISSEYKMVI
jgi:hypothetical protein